jgi:hypothetical protein
MRPLHYAALVTTGAQETARERLHRALRLDREWRYETDCARLTPDELQDHYRRIEPRIRIEVRR